jgi:hypothetical protein
MKYRFPAQAQRRKARQHVFLCVCAPVRETSWALVVAAGLILFFAACQKKSASEPSITVEAELTPQPPRVGATSITLRVADANGRPLSGARIRLEGHMSHAGMRPVVSEASEAEPGRYQASLEFTMAGDWVILIYLALPDGSRLERQLEVKAVRAS